MRSKPVRRCEFVRGRNEDKQIALDRALLVLPSSRDLVRETQNRLFRARERRVKTASEFDGKRWKGKEPGSPGGCSLRYFGAQFFEQLVWHAEIPAVAGAQGDGGLVGPVEIRAARDAQAKALGEALVVSHIFGRMIAVIHLD